MTDRTPDETRRRARHRRPRPRRDQPRRDRPGGRSAPGLRPGGALVDSIDLVVGSSSAIFACGVARLGLRTAFVGVVGDDPMGRFMLDAMRDRGVDVGGAGWSRRCRPEPRSSSPAGPTGRSSPPPARCRSCATWTSRDGLMARARHRPRRQRVPARRPAARPARPCSRRPTGPGLDHVRRTATGIRARRGTAACWEILAETDVFLPNAAEAMRIDRHGGRRGRGPGAGRAPGRGSSR